MSYCASAFVHTMQIQIHDTLRKTFASGLTLPISYRRNQLLQLARMVQENLSTILDSLNSDLGRTNTDSLANEITGCIVSAVSAANSLEEWTKPEKPKVEEWCMGWHPTIYRAPKGVAVVISFVALLTFKWNKTN